MTLSGLTRMFSWNLRRTICWRILIQSNKMLSFCISSYTWYVRDSISIIERRDQIGNAKWSILFNHKKKMSDIDNCWFRFRRTTLTVTCWYDTKFMLMVAYMLEFVKEFVCYIILLLTLYYCSIFHLQHEVTEHSPLLVN